MAKQTVNIGSAPDDGTGDTVRAGIIKVNDNTTELYGKLAIYDNQDPQNYVDGTPENWATAFSDCANASGIIRLRPGVSYGLMNFVPPSNTTIIGYGATVLQIGGTHYSTTTSSASIIVTNQNIKIIGGLYSRGVNVTQEEYTGSILIEGGSCHIESINADRTWSSIFGHESQNGTKVADYLRIINCNITGCSHNIWIADANNVLIQGVRTYESLRDGIRLYRNLQNVIIDSCHIYDNGDETAGQSRDGIDLFHGGKLCIISNNHIYGNKVHGLDIKNDSALHQIPPADIRIFGNTIRNNDEDGVRAHTLTFSPRVTGIDISNNDFRDNAFAGVYLQDVDLFNISDNKFSGHGRSAIRAALDCNDGIIDGNWFDNNCISNTSGWTSMISIETDCDNVEVTRNKSRNTTSTQTYGISHYGKGVCRENSVSGHSFDILATATTDSMRGDQKDYIVPADNIFQTVFRSDRTQFVCWAYATFVASSGTYNIEIHSVDSDGSSDRSLANQDIVITGGYVPIAITLSGSASYKVIESGQTLRVKCNVVSGAVAPVVITVGLLN